jgi:hypothetical protein
MDAVPRLERPPVAASTALEIPPVPIEVKDAIELNASSAAELATPVSPPKSST